MSEKPSEYLKRTCLICGCHTNQTINIYEPRSGPNIVELIQAKFKFQPLNDDKYLCFSCNNWLINWHSLQALNSNDAESPSGTFRSHMNNMVQEKGAGSQQRGNVCRPIAQVRPRQLATQPSAMPVATIPASASNDTIDCKPAQTSDTIRSMPKVVAKPKKLNYTKRYFRSAATQRFRRRARQLKSLQFCCVCGRSIVIRTLSRSITLTSMSIKKSLTAKCRKCRKVLKWRAVYLNSISKDVRQPQQLEKPKQSLVNTKEEQYLSQLAAAQNQSQSFPRPRVDGKVVSMLRRLGTTLSREYVEEQQANHEAQEQTNVKFPRIMSPAKQKPRWTRQLEDDEILLDFNTAISEVLPLLAEHTEAQTVVGDESGRRQVRRMLTYQMSEEPFVVSAENVSKLSQTLGSGKEIEAEPAAEQEVEVEVTERTSNQHWNPLESFYSGCLPKGLSVSLI